MPITIPRETLSRLVNASADVSKSVVSLSVTDGQLKAQATDNENWLTLTAAVDGDMDAIQVEAAKLKEVVATMRGDTFALDVDDGWLHLKAKGKRKIAGLVQPVAEMVMPAGAVATVPADTLADAYAFTANNVCEDVLKAYINGVHMHVHDGKLRMVAVSGNSASVVDMQACADDVSATVPKRAMGLLVKVASGSVAITFGERLCAFTWGGGALISRRVDAQFAPYMRFHPSHTDTLTIRSEELASQSAAMSAVATSNRVTLELGPQVAMYGQAQGASGSEPIDAEWNGPAFKQSYDAKYMARCLAGFGNVELSVGITELQFENGKPVNPQAILIRDLKKPDRYSWMMPLTAAN